MTNLAILEVFVSQPELETKDRGEECQVAALNKISRKLFIFPRTNFICIRQYFQIYRNCETFILIPTLGHNYYMACGREFFGLYIFERHKIFFKNFLVMSFLVMKIAEGQRSQPFTIHNENPY